MNRPTVTRTSSPLIRRTKKPVKSQVPRGISLSGLEFGSTVIPGALNTNFFNSSQATYNYFAGKGFNIIKLPFIWERAQPTLNGPLDSTYMGYVDGEITKAVNAGMKVILDVHNYGRHQGYLDGGITENFTESNPNLVYPYADYSQGGNIVLRSYGEAFLGTINNPVLPSIGYSVSFNMKFNSRDDTFGGEGLHIRPMRIDANNMYEFAADLADGTWTLSKIKAGVTTLLASGAQAWGTSSTYALSIDISQATNGFINISLNNSPLYATNSIPADPALSHGQTSFWPAGVHVQIDSLILNINGDTTSGGLQISTLATPGLPITAFASLWSLLSQRYMNNAGVFGYDLMNEPHDMSVSTTPSNYHSTASWYLAAQAAINAIQANNDTKYIIVELDGWAGGQNFVTNYGSNPLPYLGFTDQFNKLVISFHYYFDTDHSGTYGSGYDTINRFNNVLVDLVPIAQWAHTNNIRLFCGEYGTPNNDNRWLDAIEQFLQLCDRFDIWTTHWAAGDSYSSITSLQPVNSVDANQMHVVGNHLGVLI